MGERIPNYRWDRRLWKDFDGIYAGNGLSGALIVDGLKLYNITEASSGTGFGLQLAYG